MFIHRFAQLACWALLGSTASAQANILIVVADDVGVDMLECYGEGNERPITPVIDGLAQGGLLFRNCWSNPLCSPTRATIQTGRYSFRTGIGHIVAGNSNGLDHAELILPEVLALQANATWASAAIGKWHLGAIGDLNHPNAAGYGHFSGALHNLVQPGSYFSWTKVQNGVSSTSATYATTDTVDEALAWISTAPEPWMCYVAFNAPHDPWHKPPLGFFSEVLPPVDPRMAPREHYKASLEALDFELGRLLTGVQQGSGPTNIVFVGDNGTPREVPLPPFLPGHAKQTVYEGGINVPLLITGPAVSVAGAECEALVNTTDLFATIVDLAGAQLPAAQLPEDSVSLSPYFTNPALPSLRDFVYAEQFPVNGMPEGRFRRAVRGARYKLIRTRRDPMRDELYDLWHDRYEEVDLYNSVHPTMSAEQAAALGRLRGELDRLEGI